VFAAALSVSAGLVVLLALARAMLLGVLARRHARRARPALALPAPAVSVVVPAFNEAGVIAATVRSLAASDYPSALEIVVVDDGSTDQTAAVVERLGLPGVRVLRQDNTGKAGALNAAIASARHDIIVSVDADTVFERETVVLLVAALAAPGVGAVAGNTKVANRARRLGRWQHIEYVIGFNLDRRLYDVLSCMPTVPGAVGAFRRRALEDVGLFSSETLAEDTDLTIALNRAGWRVAYDARAIAHTEAPGSLRGLWRQRVRWTHGTMQSVCKHRAALRGHHRGHIGRRGLPYLLMQQVVAGLLAPSIDVLAVYGLLTLGVLPTVGGLVAYNALVLALAAYAFRLDGESLRPLWGLPAQQFASRQLVCWVLVRSALSALCGTRPVWQPSARAADAT
jgi:cellulose synthase/poly-beta-1,6-N-acetylglucosamine synthase-like glycosyltransferase